MRIVYTVSSVLFACASLFALEVKLVTSENSEPISEMMMANIEYAKDLWGDRLGFDRCYIGDTVTVYLRLTNAEDNAYGAFMYTNALPEEFSGSRMLKPGGTTTIVFKDRAYRRWSDPNRQHLNEDAEWWIDPAPESNYWWGECDPFEEICEAKSATDRRFCFISHMGHEFGHVFGFVGQYLQFGRIDGSPGEFHGFGSNAEPYSFRFSGNTSHAKTNMMSLGFSVWQRAFPSRVELEACRTVLGFAGTHMLTAEGGVVPAGGSLETDITCGTDITLKTVEFNASYAAGTFAGDENVVLTLTSPGGIEVDLGALRAGWAKEGFARPSVTTGWGSYNPPDTLSVFRGSEAAGTWTVKYTNSSDAEITVPACALRLTGEEKSGVIGDKPIRRTTPKVPGRRSDNRSKSRGALYTLDGRRVAPGNLRSSAAEARIMVIPGRVPALSISISPGF